MTETGIVVEALPNLNFRVKLNNLEREALAYLAGRMRRNKIKVLPGDKVIVEMSSYDDKKGRIRGRIIRRL
ncbi:MAG: translation initiation factor IF-1 [Candidatus Liptonbacteria bacterium]|nr:translation initiation factor IF-1 [Candidatus Liptonbacteria bacterium]